MCLINSLLNCDGDANCNPQPFFPFSLCQTEAATSFNPLQQRELIAASWRTPREKVWHTNKKQHFLVLFEQNRVE
jgi:hypothetical protein